MKTRYLKKDTVIYICINFKNKHSKLYHVKNEWLTINNTGFINAEYKSRYDTYKIHFTNFARYKQQLVLMSFSSGPSKNDVSQGVEGKDRK